MITVIFISLFTIATSQETWIWRPASGNVHHYDVYVSENSKEFLYASQTIEPTYTLECIIGNSYRLKVQAVDEMGNTGPASEASDSYLAGEIDYNLPKLIHGGELR